jgi:hypothetical protein
MAWGQELVAHGPESFRDLSRRLAHTCERTAARAGF